MTLRQELLARMKRAKEAGMGIKLSAYELSLLWPVVEPPARRWWEFWRRG